MHKLCRFKYTGALVLGMHDALVEMTGIMAGLAFALPSTRLLVMTGLIAGVAASLSMAAANYMAQRTDNNPDALTCALYTGTMYMATTAAVIAPFCIVTNRFWALLTMALVAVGVIFAFNWTTTCTGDRPLGARFLEMLTICGGVSIVSFLIGQGAKYFLGVTV